jgi:uncharacterized protein (TIGR03083 family)
VSRTHGSKDFWLAALRADGTTLLGAAEEPEVLVRRVPSCPDWNVGDLLRHLGAVYRRTRVNAGSIGPDESWGPVAIPAEAPAPDDPRVVEWFEGELAQINAFLEALDPDVPTWNWAPQAKVAGFWHRRTAHETAIHRWDAQLGAGLLPEPIESKLAGDGVAEVLDTFLPAGRRKAPAEVAGLVQLTAIDLGQHWFIRLKGEGVALLDTGTLLDSDAHPTRAEAMGHASDLVLALRGRVAFDVLETAGDLRLLEALRVS